MRRFVKWLLICLVIGGGLMLVLSLVRAYWKSRTTVEFRTAEVVRGDITSVVDATGEVQPVKRVLVGSVVSGPIDTLNVDFNDKVKKGDVLAKIDGRLYESNRDRERASLSLAQADLDRARATRDQAQADFERALALQRENEDFISGTEIDNYMYTARAEDAQVKVAEAKVQQAQAVLENTETNLGYTTITSPVDGIVIDRKVDEGQTVAAQFQTPDMFVVAPNLEEEVYVYASVNEAEIGRIRKAQDDERPVYFTVDAYPDDLFEGKILQVRMNSTTTQNVVTYPVVVTAANPELKLLPGMTANLSFHVEKREDAVKIPNAALRFYPERRLVRPEDHKLLDATEEKDAEPQDSSIASQPAEQRVSARRNRNRRHVWVKDADHLRAIEIRTGLGDYKYTELVEGDVKPGQKLVTGVK